jgi:hypothetical protein
VLSGARLPESEEEWSALRAGLLGLRTHLRPDSSPDRLHTELHEFVAMVVHWWENRKKSEGGAGGGERGRAARRHRCEERRTSAAAPLPPCLA